MPFLTHNRFFLAVMAVNGTEKAILWPNWWISPGLGTKMWNILIWWMRIIQNLFVFCFVLFLFFAIFRFKLFACPFPLFFLGLFYPCYLLRFISFLAVSKKLNVNEGQSLEMGPWSVRGLMAHFTTMFAPKLITLTFGLLHHNVIKLQKRLLRR